MRDGEVSLAPADRVAEIWAIDLEPDMVAVARQNALDRGIGLIHWLVGRAEDAELPEDHFGLVAVGRAFHRLNRPPIAQRSTGCLRSGGYLIDMGAGPSESILSEPSEPWLVAAAEVYESWLPRARKSRDDVSSGSGPDQPKAPSRVVLSEAGFSQVAKYEFSVPHVWEIDQFIGVLLGTWAGFELDLRTTLARLAPTGLLTETISAYFVVGRKP